MSRPGALVNEKTALIGGIAATGLAVVLVIVAISRLLGVVGDLFWLAAA